MPPVDQRKKGRPSGQHSLDHGLPENTSQLRRPALYALPDRVEVAVSLQSPEVKVVLVHSRSRTLSQNDLSRMKDGKQTSDYVVTCGDQVLTIKISSIEKEFPGSTNDRLVLAGAKFNWKSVEKNYDFDCYSTIHGLGEIVK